MRRAVILATLALLLLAIAGVTAAQEGVFENAEPAGGASEVTAPGNTAPGLTNPDRTIPEATAPGETVPAGVLVGASEEPPEAEEAEGRPGKPDKPGEKDKGSGKPKEAGRPGGAGAVEDEVGDETGGQQKVTVCHKGKTLTVGTPAGDAHLRHGDDPGACE